MSITVQGGTISITGTADIAFARLLSIRSALKLEALGLRHSRGSVLAMVKREFGLKGNRARVTEAFNALVEEAKAERLNPPCRHCHGGLGPCEHHTV